MSWFKLGSRKNKDSREDTGNSAGNEAKKESENAALKQAISGEEQAAARVAPQTVPVADSDAAAGTASTTSRRRTRKVPDALADLFLVMEEHLNPLELEDTRELLADFDERPPLIERFSKGLREPTELAKAIAAAEGLEKTLLNVANSPAFSLNTDIQDVGTLIHILGIPAVKSLVFQTVITPFLWLETPEQKAAYMRIWQSTYVASVSAYALAELLGFEKPSVHATQALLLSTGDLALITARPKLASIYSSDSQLIHRVAAQQQEIMANTAVLSSLLVKNWGLADRLYSALRHAYTVLTWPPEDNNRSEDKQQESLVLYLASRIGDAVAYHGLRDVREMPLNSAASNDMFFVPDYIDKLQLHTLYTAFDEPQTYSQIQRIIAAVAPPI